MKSLSKVKLVSYKETFRDNNLIKYVQNPHSKNLIPKIKTPGHVFIQYLAHWDSQWEKNLINNLNANAQWSWFSMMRFLILNDDEVLDSQ